MIFLVLGLVFATVIFIVIAGASLFSKSWESYEERYLKAAEHEFDTIYLTIPAQHLLFLSLVSFLVIATTMGVLFGNLLFGAVLGMPAFFLPRVLARFATRRRQHKFLDQLGEALVNMANSLRSGFSLYQSFELIQREMDNPIKQEFRILVQELRFGLPMEEALENLLKRMPSRDLDLVVSSILIAKDVGGNMAEVFENIAYTIRERLRVEGRIRALTSQGKWQGAIMCLLPFLVALAIHFINPRLIERLYTTIPGWFMIAAIMLMMALGIYFIRKIVAIDV